MSRKYWEVSEGADPSLNLAPGAATYWNKAGPFGHWDTWVTRLKSSFQLIEYLSESPVIRISAADALADIGRSRLGSAQSEWKLTMTGYWCTCSR